MTTTNTHCQWTEDDDGNWDSACGRYLSFENGSPQHHGYKFCMNCGKPILFVQYRPPTEEVKL